MTWVGVPVGWDIVVALVAIGLSAMTFLFCMLMVKSGQAEARVEVEKMKADMDVIEALSIAAKHGKGTGTHLDIH